MMHAWLNSSEAILALAPMQDVTDLPFWRLMARYGGADAASFLTFVHFY